VSRFRPASAASGSILVAVALGLIAFVAGGGTQTGRVAPVEVAVIVVGGALLAWALATDTVQRPAYGGAAVALLALFAALTGLSMAWSLTPDLSLQDASLTFAYLTAFTAAVVAARRLPAAAPALARGILAAVVGVCLWALATRIWPASLAGEVLGARLGAPFDYWNALGGMAALGVPAALWLGSRRDGPSWEAAAVYPALGAMFLTIVLTQSRGALTAAIVATVVWLAFVPLRLRTGPPLIVACLGMAPVAAWALSRDAFTATLQPLSAREAVAGDFGLSVISSLVVLTAAGLVAVHLRSTLELSVEARRRAGIAMASVLGLVALVGVFAVLFTGGGIGARLDELKSTKSAAPSGAERLGSTSSSRGEYWREVWHVFKDAPVIGRGADGFSLARLPYRNDFRAVNHAHGFWPQTLADFGLIGLLVAFGLLAAWAVAVARTLGIRAGPRAPEWGGDRLALTALALCALAYGLQSAIDWTWFIPGPTVAALAAAGFVAGRGPLTAVTASPAAPPAPAGARIDPLRLIGAAAVVVTALLSAWMVWQPYRSTSATDKAVTLTDQGKWAQAVEQADRARDIDPYSTDPLYAKADALIGGGQKVAGYRVLEQAVAEHPRDPQTWLTLGQSELDDFDLPARALGSAHAAFTIDPQSPRAVDLVRESQKALAAPPGS
jgi:O-Antigen ligase